MYEEYIIEQVTKWFYEDIINDIFGLRRNVILAPNGEPYRYFISDRKIYSGVDEYRNRSVTAQMRYDKSKALVNAEYQNNSMDILCKAIAMLSDILEAMDIYSIPIKRCDYRHIKSYFSGIKVTGLENLNGIYQYFSGKNKDEILEILNNKEKTDRILEEVVLRVPKFKICTMYHYYRYHTMYNESVYIECEKIFIWHTPYITFLIMTESVDETMEKIQSQIVSNINIQKWYQIIYGHAIEVSKVYPSLKKMIPTMKNLKSLIKTSYKIWNVQEEQKGKFRSKDYSSYADSIMELTRDKAIVSINRKGRTSKYSGNDANGIELRTLHNTFFPFIHESFGLKNINSKYTCPEFMLKEFIQLCENSYIYGIHKKKGIYLDAYKEKEYLEKIVKLYITFFIIYAFDEDMCDETTDFITFINNCIYKSQTKTLLKFFEFLAYEEKFEHYNICIKIINDILKNYRN